ncbi:sulfotransferase family 2 domain-containing protein [Salinimicrobium sp. MT39]|uniref:Sulfotransferase family 2 domain-containing protein n=1 Tax=Salinimicrobium profundisediminis TaxID=2994553 RepID=A0A9X3CVK8_9FLAO|nr:sulfotransferase family 2 domain-containing protein [Salinimicrobium profundisediminis]MCX2837494.1 sulfotransferase family 2 domain-containing protein [Salinimicrobium profundisediminis]
MISHKHGCIFIHIPKTGGMSIENAFMKSLNLRFYNGQCPPLMLTYNKNPKIGPLSLAHLSSYEYVQHSYLSQKLYKDYFKFAIVRNPYERIVSIYRHFNYDRIISFTSFIKYVFPKLHREKHYFVKPQVEYLFGKDNECLIDYIGRFENLQEDFKRISEKLPFPLSELEHINSSVGGFNIYSRWNIRFIFNYIIKEPSSIFHLNINNKISNLPLGHFTPKTLEFVNEYYKDDFTELGYKRLQEL